MDEEYDVVVVKGEDGVEVVEREKKDEEDVEN